MGGAGTQTAGLAFGGGPSITGATEEYNGTTWATSPGSLNTARRLLGGAGIQTAALAFGGDIPPNTGATEEYDGTSWTTSPGSLNTARNSLAGCGTQTAGLAFGGSPTTGATEEWLGAGSPQTKTITAS
jgi:hypothetical protein